VTPIAFVSACFISFATVAAARAFVLEGQWLRFCGSASAAGVRRTFVDHNSWWWSVVLFWVRSCHPRVSSTAFVSTCSISFAAAAFVLYGQWLIFDGFALCARADHNSRLALIAFVSTCFIAFAARAIAAGFVLGG
jgi:hypothetical protein